MTTLFDIYDLRFRVEAEKPDSYSYYMQNLIIMYLPKPFIAL